MDISFIVDVKPNKKWKSSFDTSNESMSQIMKNSIGGVKIITYAVRPIMREYEKCPYETYIIEEEAGHMQSATVCHTTYKEARAFHVGLSRVLCV